MNEKTIKSVLTGMAFTVVFLVGLLIGGHITKSEITNRADMAKSLVDDESTEFLINLVIYGSDIE
mgnify:FL=1